MLAGVALAAAPVGPTTMSLVLAESALSWIPLLAITSDLFVFNCAKVCDVEVTDSAGQPPASVSANVLLPQSVVKSAVPLTPAVAPSIDARWFLLSIFLTYGVLNSGFVGPAIVTALTLPLLLFRYDSVKDATKLSDIMRTVTRDDVNAPYSRCRDCNCKTRSHVLEPAEYEIYKAEVISGTSDIYSAQGWEEVDEVEKYEMVTEPTVMCHKCWLVKQDRFADLIKAKYDLWMDKTILHVAEIKKAVNTQIAYDFEDDTTIHALKNLAKQLKEAALDA